jgi:hypothetical protein
VFSGDLRAKISKEPAQRQDIARAECLNTCINWPCPMPMELTMRVQNPLRTEVGEVIPFGAAVGT